MPRSLTEIADALDAADECLKLLSKQRTGLEPYELLDGKGRVIDFASLATELRVHAKAGR